METRVIVPPWTSSDRQRDKLVSESFWDAESNRQEFHHHKTPYNSVTQQRVQAVAHNNKTATFRLIYDLTKLRVSETIDATFFLQHVVLPKQSTFYP